MIKQILISILLTCFISASEVGEVSPKRVQLSTSVYIGVGVSYIGRTESAVEDLAEAVKRAINSYITTGAYSIYDDSIFNDPDKSGSTFQIGYNAIKYVNIEARSTVGFSGGYKAYSISIKPTYNKMYGIIGYQHEIIDDYSSDSPIIGIGVNISNLFIDCTYSINSTTYIATVGYTYMF